MTEEIEQAERELDKVTDQLGRLGSAQPLGKRNGIEARYGQAYQRLVRLGARSPIRAKYWRVS